VLYAPFDVRLSKFTVLVPNLADVTTWALEANGVLESHFFPGLRIPLRDLLRRR
jgi:hypothetical protein